jgi:hypothetical protein
MRVGGFQRVARTLGAAGCFVALLGASRASCQSPASSGTQQIEPRLEFAVVGSSQRSGGDTITVTDVAADGVTLSGTMSTPNPCYNITPDLSADGDSLTLALAATAQAGMCIQVLAAFRYEARIGGLPPGRYSIAVEYTYPNTGWGGRVFPLAVEVPEQ